MEEIKSLQNPLVKHLVKLVRDKAYRYHCSSVLLMGRKLIKDLAKDFEIELLLSCEEESFPAKRKLRVSQAIIDKIVKTTSSESILAELKLPLASKFSLKGRGIIFDAISDPANMGALLRSALAFSWDYVIFLEGSCDPFNDKVLRASRGALFYLPYSFYSHEDFLAQMDKESLFYADLEGEDLTKFSLEKEDCALVFGNEARGVNEKIKAGKALSITMDSRMESLNVAVAAGIFLERLRRKA